jgi:uncharacterized protein (TIGR03435 family)
MPRLRQTFRAVALTALVGLTAVTSQAQSATQAGAPTGAPPALDPTYTPRLTFDIATIREVDRSAGGSVRVGVVSPPRSSEFTATNFTAKSLIQLAYGFGNPIAGDPDWLSTHSFNVQGKADAEADAKLARLTSDQARMEKQHMVQALLAERFGFKYHWENRPSSVYELTVAKGGSKLHALTPPVADADHPNPTLPAADVKATGGQHGLEFKVTSMTLGAVAAMLVSQLEKPVVDKTGLTGVYEFTLQMGRDWSARDPDSWPDIFTAVQEQLGLKLESTKAVVPVLVIDHIDLPTAN